MIYRNFLPEWAKQTAAFGDEYNFCFQMSMGRIDAWISLLRSHSGNIGKYSLEYFASDYAWVSLPLVLDEELRLHETVLEAAFAID